MSKRTKRLLKENNELEQQVNDENKQVLTDIIVYIRSAKISPYYQEMVRRDIWEMMIDGEKRGKNPKEIIGEDYKKFCDNVIAEIPKLSKKETLLLLLRDTLPSVIVLMAIWFTFSMIELIINFNTWPYFTVTVGNAVSGILIILAVFFVYAILSKEVFDSSILANKKIFWLLFAVLLICMSTNAFIKNSLFEVHAITVVFGMIALFVIYKIIDVKIDCIKQ